MARLTDAERTRLCTSCLGDQDVDQFYRRKNGNLLTECKTCVKAKSHAWYVANKERVAERNRRTQDRYAPYHRDWKYRRNFGITTVQYEMLLAQQGGVCALCGQPPHPRKRLAVDHHHPDGFVRGLLCPACNMAMGVVDRCPEWWDRVQEYLRGC